MISLATILLALCVFFIGASAAPATDTTTADSIEINSKGCRIVKKTLTVTWEVSSPNGNARPVIHVNRQFPAPDLFFDEDDDVEITVTNHMPTNTTVHWHGLLMEGTPWSDGVPGLGQTPIEPGGSYIYRFKAYPAGTYWYHSHSRMALLDGFYGGLFIRPKAGTVAPWSLISSDKKDITAIAAAAHDPTLLVTSDWTNYTSDVYFQAQVDSGLDIFCTDSILINGKGALYCPPHQEILDMVPFGIAYILEPGIVNDKGCLPFVQITEDDYWKTAHPELIPPGLQEGCVAANNSKDAMSIITVDPADKWISLNIVMASTLRASVLSIDNHEMWVYEVDGSYVEPVKVQSTVLYPGQRHAVMIKLDQTPSDYNIRIAGSPAGGIISAYAVFSYKGGKPMKNYTLGYTLPSQQKAGWINYGSGNMTANLTQFDGNADLSPSFPPNPPAMPKIGDPAHYIQMERFGAAWQWSLNSQSVMPVDASAYAPLIYDKSYPGALHPDLVIRTNNGTWVDLILQGGAPPGPVEVNHAIHKHASKFWVIGTAPGVWNYTSVAEAMIAEPESFNLVNPNYRDSTVTPFYTSWVAIRYFAANPGPWLLHCHVETHLAGGMAMVLLDGVDKWPTIPPEYAINQNGFPVRGSVYNDW